MGALYIDADACPVKAEAERVATRHRIRMYVVSNGGLRPSQNPLVETVIVPDGPDVADMWIAERAGPGDVVITADIPLAAKCVAAGAQEIDIVISRRHVLTGNWQALYDEMRDMRAACGDENFELKNESGEWVTFNNVQYINPRKPEFTSFILKAIPTGKYTTVKFRFGIDTARNYSNSLPNTAENRNMFWPEPMGGGYHHMKFEGKFTDKTGTQTGFAYHNGTASKMNPDGTRTHEANHLVILSMLQSSH